MTDYTYKNYNNSSSSLLKYNYYTPSSASISTNKKALSTTTKYATISFGDNKDVNLGKSKKSGLSTSLISGIAVATVSLLAIGTDFLFCKGKHVKNLLNKLKLDKSIPEVKPEVKPRVKPEIKINSLEEAIGIKPIKNEEEYNIILERLKQQEEWGDNLYGWHKNPLITTQNIHNYPTCQDIEKGVIAYAGYDDIHIALNSYLSGRTLPSDFSKQMGEDFTRLVDYSLREMDKTFPPYNGITYRVGFFDPKVKQYYSTSKSPKTFPYGHKEEQHTIFVSKKGHDIEAFQKAKNASASRQRFIDEHEVLMDVTAEYRALSELTPELIEKRLEYAKTILTERKEALTEENIRKLISEIKVYEEI